MPYGRTLQRQTAYQKETNKSYFIFFGGEGRFFINTSQQSNLNWELHIQIQNEVEIPFSYLECE